MPNPSQRYGETVCCAGVTAEGKWKRLYPIRFRQMEAKFHRWDWINFKYRIPSGDPRAESCHVFEDKVRVDGKLTNKIERARLLNPLVSLSTDDAALHGLSLTLVRPSQARFHYKKKSHAVIDAERAGYERVLKQTSFLDEALVALEPSPYAFAFSFQDAAGKHDYRCGDWETSATFWKWKRSRGEEAALRDLSETYNENYPSKGMVFAMGTVKARPKQWLLLGIIRLNELTDLQRQQTAFEF